MNYHGVGKEKGWAAGDYITVHVNDQDVRLRHSIIMISSKPDIVSYVCVGDSCQADSGLILNTPARPKIFLPLPVFQGSSPYS